MKTVSVTIRISEEMLKAIDSVADNRSQFIIEATDAKLNPEKYKGDGLSDKEKAAVLKGAKNINDFMRDAILQEASKRERFLSSLSNEDFAKLITARLPKEAGDNTDLEADVLSLRECLAMLPSVEDITLELSKMKGNLFKTERERDLNLALLKHNENKVQLAELMESIYRGVVEYTADLIARGSFPGFGDGGGLSARGYADIAQKVKRELAEMELYRSGKK